MSVTRRQFLTDATIAATAVGSVATGHPRILEATEDFRLKYLLGSCLYGYEKLALIMPEVSKTGALAIDIWPKVHGDQREQLDELGEESFKAMLAEHRVSLGCITQYKLGPFGLQDEMRLAKRLGCKTIVTGAVGPKNMKGKELKSAIAAFVEKLKPHLDVAEETDVTIAIENHSNNLIESPDSLRYLAELSPSKHLAIAFAPYHLPQDPTLLESLLSDIVHRLEVFYGWQHGKGAMTKLPKEEELLQMPGRGSLDFGSMLSVLKNANYQGWTEIFMHPFPRGVPILETPSAVTDEVNRARSYLAKLLNG